MYTYYVDGREIGHRSAVGPNYGHDPRPLAAWASKVGQSRGHGRMTVRYDKCKLSTVGRWALLGNHPEEVLSPEGIHDAMATGRLLRSPRWYWYLLPPEYVDSAEEW